MPEKVEHKVITFQLLIAPDIHIGRGLLDNGRYYSWSSKKLLIRIVFA